jgi:undecaprenyl-phosphate 4-deoxy-4-formamido-L-arabinose transferase
VLGRTVSSGEGVVVVVPVHRNAATLAPLVERLGAALEGVRGGWSVRLIVDACPEGSGPVAAAPAVRDAHVRVTWLDRNVGQHAALTQGLLAEPDAAVWVCMDADLQDPPEAVPALLDRLAAGDVAGCSRDAVGPTRPSAGVSPAPSTAVFSPR